MNPTFDGGAGLLNAGRANNVDRAQTVGGRSFTPLRRLYALLLRKYAKAISSRLEPYGTILRRPAWHQLLPSIHRDCANRIPDVIWVEHTYLFPLAVEMRNHFPSAQIICNAHNVETALHSSMAANTFPSSARQWVEIEGSIVQHWERKMMNEADTVICCSEPDAVRFKDLIGPHSASVKVIPNGVDTEYFHVCEPSISRPQLLFAGTAGYAPNDDAVDWLIREIFPRVLESNPECQLVLAGRSAEKCWGHLRKVCRNLKIHSDVPDMRPLIADASICVVPLRSGSGTRLKILEAMSCGRALVSTQIGAEGIMGVAGTHWLLADQAQEFADCVTNLLDDTKRRRSLELAGRSLVESRYSWNALTEGCFPLILSSNCRQENY
jgi:glycosyltransferase involved in cell wall biosynthesis